MRYTIKVRRTRRVYDRLRRRYFVAVAVSPGGKEIVIAKRATRERAYQTARVATRVTGSPTAGGFGSYAPGANPHENPTWQDNPQLPIFQP